MKNKYKNFNFIAGMILFSIVALMAIVGLFYTPYNPEKMNASLKNAGVSWSHIMGCDNFGRDIFSRVMKGCGTTFGISFTTVFIGTVVGGIIGAVSGYFGGVLDNVLMRIVDALFSFPSILLALVIISLLGSGTGNLILALGIAFIPSFARMVRAEYKKQRGMDYCLAARLMGASHFRIMFIHILPNILGVLLQSILIGFNNAVLAEAGLSFLGIGVQPPKASLGVMLSDAETFVLNNPSYALFPGLIIVILVLGLSLISEGLKNAS